MKENNLIKHLPTMDEIDDTLAMIESFELQDIKKAIGEESFFVLMDLLKEMSNHHDTIMMLGAMDRLLSTDRNSLIEYRDDFSNLRVYSSKEEKAILGDELINDIINSNIRYLVEELPVIGEFNVVVNTLLILNINYLYTSAGEGSTYHNVILKSMSDDAQEFHDLLDDVNVEELISAFYDLEAIVDSESVNDGVRYEAYDFFEGRDFDDYDTEDIKELISILKKLS
ncbi:hypothetical protein LCFBJUUZ_CDS0048 [Staphylococcus phage PG-2021_76]